VEQVLAAAVAPGDPPVLSQPGQVGGPQLGHRGRERRLAAAHPRVRHDQVHRLGQEHLLAEVVRLRCRDRFVVLALATPARTRQRVARARPPAVGGLVPEDQRNIHVAGPEHAHRFLRLGLGQPQVDARIPLVQDRRRGGHDRTERRGERGEPQPPGAQPGEDREFVLRRVEAADHLDGPLGEQPSRVGEPDAAPRPLDELGARLRLQPRQVVADRRLGVVERVGGRGDRPVPGDGHQDAEPRYIQHAPTIDAIDYYAQRPIPG